MRPLFSASGMHELARHIHRPCLFVFDFDGVLAPLIAARAKARPRPRTVALLKQLGKHAGVAVLSGRSLRDLRRRIGFRPLYFIGNHGAEGLPGLLKQEAATKKAVAQWARVLQKDLRQLPGCEMENKKLSLSIHYRRAKNRLKAKQAIVDLAQALTPKPRTIHGTCVVNLVSENAPNKGTALKALTARSGFSRFLFVGDDYTDEDAFRIRDNRVFTVRVGDRRGSAATYFIPNQKRIDDLLCLIISSFRQGP